MSNEETAEPKYNEFQAFERFRDEIESQAKQRADVILSEAQSEATKIIEAGKKEAERYKAELLSRVKNDAQLIKVREVSKTRLNGKMEYLQTREKVFDEVLLEANSKLQSFTKSKEYSNFLNNLLKSSAISIAGGNLSVVLRAEDKSLLSQDILDKISKEVTKELGSETKLSISKNTLNSLGGLKLIREDDKLFIDNTFEARLSRMRDEIRVSLSNVLEA